MITVVSRKYDGTIRRTWQCDLLEQRDSLLVFVGEFATDIEHPDLGQIKKGTISYEYYWLDRWYNVFRFYEPTGEFRNFYCNINSPPTFSGEVLDYVDLDIDLLVRPDYSYVVLDVEEYESNAERFRYTPDVREKVGIALQEVISMIESHQLPGPPEVFATSHQALRENG